ncbi:MAG: response regulator [Deltaproteobacteria bacterium]|nr:response regulator [Deltaproteobacteria bacterium]
MNYSEISILLVDDDEMIRNCICAFLEDEGFMVHQASSGEEALDSIVAINPTVCISDMRLAGMDGETFIRRAYLLCPSTAYLLHTGMDYPLSDELRAIGMTSADVLQKPIHELSTLTRRIAIIASAGGRIG